jgi:peroxiredoxin
MTRTELSKRTSSPISRKHSRCLQGMLAALLLISPLLVAGTTGLIGKPAPDFALKSVAGPNLRLSEYRSDVVVLNFWSNWCGKCINAVNALEELNRQHRSSGLRVFTIDVDGRNGAQLAKEVDPGYPVLLDVKSLVSKAYDLSRLPITVLIDREGTVRFVQKGFKGNAEHQLQAEVLALLDE